MKEFFKRRYNVLIPLFLLVVLLLAILLYAREYKNNRYARIEEVNVYQYFSGHKMEYKASISRNKKDVVLDFADAPVTWADYGSDITFNNATYKRVSMNYVLASKAGSQLTQVKASFKHNFNATAPLEQVVINVPVRQNHRTNILGNVFTEGNEFTIIVSPGFTDDYVL